MQRISYTYGNRKRFEMSLIKLINSPTEKKFIFFKKTPKDTVMTRQ
jgi:hypothetical protein